MWNLKRFVGRFPSCMGLIWFFLGLDGETLRTWKGNTISDPFPLISSKKMRATETWCHFSAFQNFCSHCMFDHVWFRWKASILRVFKNGWASVKFEAFHREVPKLHGSNLVFPWPRWWNFKDMKGQYHFRLCPPDIFWEDGGQWNLMSLLYTFE